MFQNSAESACGEEMSVMECELEESEWCEAHGNDLPCAECQADLDDLYMETNSKSYERTSS